MISFEPPLFIFIVPFFTLSRAHPLAGDHIDIVGNFFVDQSSGKEGKPPYQPPDDLKKWLEAGEPPVFVGFGSMVIADTASLVEMILSAAEETGARVLVQR